MIKKEYVERRMDFEKSFNFYIKDKETYKIKDCHHNSYIIFDDNNQKLIDNNPKDFSFHTGLLCNKKLNLCLIHSWIEYRGSIIDVTSIANLQFVYAEKIDSKMRHEAKKYIDTNYRFINYIVFSNQEFTDFINKCYYSSNYQNKNLNEIVGDSLNKIIDLVKNDEQYLTKIKNKFGYDLAPDDFMIEIN